MTSTRVEDFNLEDWLPVWISANDLIAFLAALAVLITFLAIWQALRPGNPFDRRYAQILQRREGLRQVALDPKRRQQQLTAAGFMHHVVERLNLLRSQRAHDARMLLAQAGMRSNEAMVRYLFARLAMPFAFGAVVLIDSYGAQMLPVGDKYRTFVAVGAALLGFFAPDVFIKNLIKKRAHQMELGLPDALDLLVICAEAGLSLDASLQRVSRELELTWPELSEEYGLTAAELTYLPDRRQAFENLNLRTNMASIRGVVNTLLQTAKFGTPLAQSLRILAQEFRDARLVRAEEKAARLPAMLTVPMILFILPTLFIVLLGPAALSIIDTFSGKGNASAAAATRTTSSSTGGGGGGGGGGSNTIIVNERAGAASFDGSSDNMVVVRGVPVKTLETPKEARIFPAQQVAKVGALFTVDVDARALAKGTQQVLVVASAGAPDAAPPPEELAKEELAKNAVAVSPVFSRITITPHTPGASELRLYYVPPDGSVPVIAARAPLEVSGDVAGAAEPAGAGAPGGETPQQ